MKRFYCVIFLVASIVAQAAEPITGCYWEWMNGNISKEGITKDLEYMKAAGIESAFIFDAWVGVERGPIDYGSREWIEAVKHACQEAKRLGIVLGLHNSPGYTAMGGPWIKPEESMKQLTWSVSSRKPPVPKHKMQFYRDIATFRTDCADEMQDLNCHLESGDTVVIRLRKSKPFVGFNLWRGAREKPLDPHDGPRDYAPNLSISVSEDAVNWEDVGMAAGVGLHAHDIPIYFQCKEIQCRYVRLITNRSTNLDRIEILTSPGSGTTYRRVGYTTTGQMVTAASEGGIGLEVDKLSRIGIQAHCERFLCPLLDELREYCGTTLRYLIIDSWEAGRQDWTESLGVDYLVSGDGKNYLRGGLGKINPTKQRLFMDEFVRPLQEMVHSYGMVLVGEPYGNGDFDRKEYALSLDLPMSEYWARCHYGSIERPYFVSRYGHTGGKEIIGCEFGTAYPGDADIPAVLSSFKEDIDKVCEAGVNFFVLHCVALQDRDDRPMTMGPFGTRFDRMHANVDSVRAITDYMRERVASQKQTITWDYCTSVNGLPLYIRLPFGQLEVKTVYLTNDKDSIDTNVIDAQAMAIVYAPRESNLTIEYLQTLLPKFAKDMEHLEMADCPIVTSYDILKK